jgi:hypothetical protein
VVVAIFATLGISCQREVNTEVTLPDEQIIFCDAGDKPQLSFTAESNWHLSSNALWCNFITPTGEQQEMAGKAGSVTVMLKVSDLNLSTKDTIATITIRMGGKSGTLATVERSAKELYLKLYDADGNITESLELGYESYIESSLEANFEFAAIDLPEWVEVAERDASGKITVTNAISGRAGERKTVLLRIVRDGERENVKISAEDMLLINFANRDRSVSFKYAIVYNGMGKNFLTFTGPTASTFGWEVSLDGKTFRNYDEGDDTTTTFSDELQYKIVSEDNNYHILLIEEHIERGIPSFECFDEGDAKRWIEFDKERMTLRINEHEGKPRYGAVMALPSGIYEELAGNYDAIFEEDTSAGLMLPTINSDYTKFVLIDFVQHDIYGVKTMYAYHSLSSLEIYCEPYANAELATKYGTEAIFKCDFVNPIAGKTPGVIINPLIEGWDTTGHDKGIAGVEVIHSERTLKVSEGEYYIGDNTDEELSVHLWGPKGGWNGEDVVIVFKINNIAQKVLVVTPPAQ